MNKIYCLIAAVVLFFGYGIVGTSEHVDEIKQRAPTAISERGWDLLRYEGFNYGSFAAHGGKVWYHVQNTDNHNVQYRVFITMWNGELQFYYDQPEELNRLDVNID
jgi:hypothetical protein